MKLNRVLPIALCCILLCGCWDRVEIDRRIFISTIAIDAGEDIENKEKLKDIKENDPFQANILKKFSITYGFPDVSGISPGTGGRPKGQLITVKAYSMEDGIAQASARSSRDIHLEETKLLIISSDIFAHPDAAKEVMDYLERYPRLNRMMQVVIADGKAESYLKYKPTTENSSEAYLVGLLQNSTVNSTILPIRLNELLKLLNENGNAILPRLSMDRENKNIVLSGIGIIKNFQFEGYMSPSETSALEILRGKIKGGRKVIYKNGHPVSFVIGDVQRKINVDTTGDKPKFNIDIKVDGKITEYFFGEKIFTDKEISKLENDFSQSLSNECRRVIDLTQNKFQTDPIGFREYVEKYHPKEWEKIKNNWEQVYKNAKIDVSASVKIRRVGAVQ